MTGADDMFVQIRDLTVTFETASASIAALSGISLNARRNEFLAIVGPSGCGKSTLMQCLAGLQPFQGGGIAIDGQPVDGPYLEAGLVLQSAALLEWRTALDNVMLQAEVRRLPIAAYRKRARELLALVGLVGFENAYPDELSGGMRQRVSICRALLHDPKLLLMDEPFGALDALTRERMNQELERTWMSTEKTVVFITHDMEEACFLADRVVVMSPRPGRVVSQIVIDFPRPRSLNVKSSPEFRTCVEQDPQ